MSRHGYRFVGYGGLVRDIAASEYNHYPERHSVEVSMPSPVVQPPQQSVIQSAIPYRVQQAIDAELANEVDLAMNLVNKSADLYSAFLKAKEYGRITGNCNIDIVSAEPDTVPHFEIAIKAVLPD